MENEMLKIPFLKIFIWSPVSGLENREYGSGDLLRWPRDTLYLQTLALTSPTSGGRSVGIVRPRTKATELSQVKSALVMRRVM
jgi:hypothetical protein